MRYEIYSDKYIDDQNTFSVYLGRVRIASWFKTRELAREWVASRTAQPLNPELYAALLEESEPWS